MVATGLSNWLWSIWVHFCFFFFLTNQLHVTLRISYGSVHKLHSLMRGSGGGGGGGGSGDSLCIG